MPEEANSPDNKKTIEFNNIPVSEKPASITVGGVVAALPTVITVGKQILDLVTDDKDEVKAEEPQQTIPIVVEPKQDNTTGFRLNSLPVHDEDFAVKWFYGTQANKTSEYIIHEFNTYLQVLEELEQDKIELPEGFKGPKLADELKAFILKDFATKSIKLNAENNLAHRAFYAHCTKRAIDSIRNGVFINEAGYERKYPEVADTLEKRVNEIMFQKLIN